MKAYPKPKPWKGTDLTGEWLVTFKIDGVRVIRDENNKLVSRNGKPLYNLDNIPDTYMDCEVFDKDWATSVTLVKTMYGQPPVKPDQVYNLYPEIDQRLILGLIRNPTIKDINTLLESATKQGYEGLVLRQDDINFKVKTVETYDVTVTGVLPGKGKYTGLVGALITDKGNVGTGLTDLQRKDFLALPIGSLIEVSCMELTPKGKFRHPRFIRVRWDK